MLVLSGLRQGLRRARGRMRKGLARQEEDPQVVRHAAAEGRGRPAPAQHAPDEPEQRPALEPHAARAAVALVVGLQVGHLRMTPLCIVDKQKVRAQMTLSRSSEEQQCAFTPCKSSHMGMLAATQPFLHSERVHAQSVLLRKCWARLCAARELVGGLIAGRQVAM